MSADELELGIVTRLDGDNIGYINDRGRSLSFRPEDIEGYRGQPMAVLGIVEGTTVAFAQDTARRITKVFPLTPELIHEIPSFEEGVSRGRLSQPRPHDRRAEDKAQGFDFPTPSTQQVELHPSAPPTGRRNPGRALPPRTRKFAKLIDTSVLRAGDLLLSRSTGEGDWISEQIADVQLRLGYGNDDARWVHVAMYMGDDENVVEATVEGLVAGGNVRITSLDGYCDGTNILRFRRSSLIENERDGFLVCLKALSRLGQAYSVGQALRAWASARLGLVAYDANADNILANGTLCSTLYADSFNRALRCSLGEANGICVPAWFSAANEFVDVNVGWLAI